MLEFLAGLAHLALFPGGLYALAFGLFLAGLDRRLEARLQRRLGPPLLQPFLDIAKLCTKEVLIPDTAQRTAFVAAPVVSLAGILVCAALIPVPGVSSGLPNTADLLVIFYLFPLPAMALMLGGSASGSPYGGLGFAREMVMTFAYELPLLIVILTLALKAGDGQGAEFSLDRILAIQHSEGSFGLRPALWPALLAWLCFLSATLGKAPFDVPEAETEILEGPLLEYSGPLLALFQLSAAVKTVVVLGLGVALFFPGTLPGGLLVNLVWFMLKGIGFMILGLTLVKAATGRFRVDQALAFFVKYPAALALASLLLVWLGF